MVGPSESIMGSIIRTSKDDDNWNICKDRIIEKTMQASYLEKNKAFM